jgi:hypothetical protein
MAELDRGTDRAGRRSKRFLSPSQKYEIWLQLVRQEVTIAEAASQQHVDRSTIMRTRTVAKEGALAALAASKSAATHGAYTISAVARMLWACPSSLVMRACSSRAMPSGIAPVTTPQAAVRR